MNHCPHIVALRLILDCPSAIGRVFTTQDFKQYGVRPYDLKRDGYMFVKEGILHIENGKKSNHFAYLYVGKRLVRPTLNSMLKRVWLYIANKL